MRAAGRHATWRCKKLFKQAIYLLSRRLYRDTDGDLHNTVMVAGTARSGTTWLASIIASQLPCRIMFEPFHSRKVREFRHFHYFQYVRPMEENAELRAYCEMIFTGRIRDGWIDRRLDRLRPTHRLVKEIRANLFLRWVHRVFPEVPLVFIIRHPCAVVLSRMRLGWATDTDIGSFIAQPSLVEDFLYDKMEIIRRAKTVEEKHAIIWCISNLVPLTQFQSDGLNVVFYEDLCLQPDTEVPRIFRMIGHSYHDSILETMHEPSITATRSSAVVTGHDRVERWREFLSAAQIHRVLSVVEAFELDHIYGDSVTPLIRDLS